MKSKKSKSISAADLKKQIPGLTLAKMKQYLHRRDDIHLITILNRNQQKQIRIMAKKDPDIQLAKKNKKLKRSSCCL